MITYREAMERAIQSLESSARFTNSEWQAAEVRTAEGYITFACELRNAKASMNLAEYDRLINEG